VESVQSVNDTYQELISGPVPSYLRAEYTEAQNMFNTLVTSGNWHLAFKMRAVEIALATAIHDKDPHLTSKLKDEIEGVKAFLIQYIDAHQPLSEQREAALKCLGLVSQILQNG